MVATGDAAVRLANRRRSLLCRNRASSARQQALAGKGGCCRQGRAAARHKRHDAIYEGCRIAVWRLGEIDVETRRLSIAERDD